MHSGLHPSLVWRWLKLCGIALSLSACSLIPRQDDKAPEAYRWAQTFGQLEAQTQWRLFGKIGIRTADESMSAAINEWTQRDDMYDLHLSSTFLGLGAARLQGNQHFVVLEESGSAPLSSDQPDALIAHSLGFPLPMANLKYWLKGIPAPGTFRITARTPSGLPSEMEQFGWHLTFSKHHDLEGLPLPGKIKLQREDVRIILAIKEWTLL